MNPNEIATSILRLRYPQSFDLANLHDYVFLLVENSNSFPPSSGVGLIAIRASIFAEMKNSNLPDNKYVSDHMISQSLR